MSKFGKSKAFNRIYGPEIIGPVMRGCYFSLDKPKPYTGPLKDGEKQQGPRFEATLVMDQGNARHEAFIAEMDQLFYEMLEEYNADQRAKRQPTLGDVYSVKDGNSENQEKYPFFAGKWLTPARASEKNPPSLLGPDGQPCDASLFVGGVMVKPVVSLHLGSNGAALKLIAIKMVKDDGVRFGGGMRDISGLIAKLAADTEGMSEEDIQEQAEIAAMNGQHGDSDYEQNDTPEEEAVAEIVPEPTPPAKPVGRPRTAPVAAQPAPATVRTAAPAATPPVRQRMPLPSQQAAAAPKIETNVPLTPLAPLQ
jgi:hypothetical protein